ncbi:carboxypeptidase-like regulatory domain-containing protein, partial [Bacteroides acidifaciens]
MKTNQFRAVMLVLLMAVVSLGTVSAQAITVSGTVTDAKDGTPLVGCSVSVKGTTNGVITNMDGQYSILTKKGETLLFHYIGYKQEQRVVKSSQLNVKLKTDNVALEECVVVGYGAMKSRAMTG